MIGILKKLQGTFTGLLAALVLLLLLQPAFRSMLGGRFLLDVVFTVVFLSAIVGVCTEKQELRTALLMGVPAILFRWGLHLTGPFLILMGLTQCFAVLFFSYISYLVLSKIIKAERVSFDSVAGGISVYFLLGVIFASVFFLIDYWEPGSIRFPDDTGIGDPSSPFHRYMYFSFVTLASLGFGDVLPISDIARSVTIFEAVLGQMYIAVLISALVGLVVAQNIKKGR